MKYFKTRDLEQNIVNIELDRVGEASLKNFKKTIQEMLDGLLTFSLFYTVGIISLSVLTIAKYDQTAWAYFFGAKEERSILLFGNPLTLWDTPIALALAWIMFLLRMMSKIRLVQMEGAFASWNQEVEDAVHYHCVHYCEKKR